MAPSSEELTGAILQSVQHGNYPDSESVASAELSADTLPSLLHALDSARDEIKVRKKPGGTHISPDVNGP